LYTPGWLAVLFQFTHGQIPGIHSFLVKIAVLREQDIFNTFIDHLVTYTQPVYNPGLPADLETFHAD
jgi:hypothetical protein